MKKHMWAFSGLTLSNLFLIVVLLFAESDNYLYPVFGFNITLFLYQLAVILIFDLVLVGVYLLTGNKPILKIVALALVALILLYVGALALGLSVGGAYWHSENDDFDRMTEVDSYLDFVLHLSGLKLSDILAKDILLCEDFYYYYRHALAVEQFTFKGTFTFERDNYESLINSLSEVNEFKLVLSDEMPCYSGYFELDDGISFMQKNTTVDKWKTMIIRFSDESNLIYFELSGVCYT